MVSRGRTSVGVLRFGFGDAPSGVCMKNASPKSVTRTLQSGAIVSLGVNMPAGLIWYFGTLDPIGAPSYRLTSNFSGRSQGSESGHELDDGAWMRMLWVWRSVY